MLRGLKISQSQISKSQMLDRGRDPRRASQPEMLLAHVPRCKDADETRGRGSLFDVGAALRLLALDQAHHSGNFESKLARGFDRLHRGRAGGADVVDDHYLGALLAEALD